MNDIPAYPAAGLVDRFGRAHTYLRISVTDRCNLRCAYCMPDEEMAWKRREELLSDDEIVRIARVAVGLGVTKIRVTGGEPLVRPGIELLLARIRALPGLHTLAITTNAVLLADKLPHIRRSVDALNISLDTFRADRFRALTGRDMLPRTLAGIDAALQAGYRNLKINMVAMNSVNDDELLDFVRFTADRPVTMRFIEFMPFAANRWSARSCMTMRQMLAAITREFEIEPLPAGRSPISRDFRVRDGRTGREHLGKIGVIASMSRPFCNSCSRLRVTAEGMLMPCLHSPIEFDLRDALRSGRGDDVLADTFRRAVAAKPKEHLPAGELVRQASRVMIQIGG